ncbi:MAG TPA: tetratricopeptide repeat protein [Ramlibacter sp.]|nr:tetratricopeptide repeat protein [Ramlibacter sp.]
MSALQESGIQASSTQDEGQALMEAVERGDEREVERLGKAGSAALAWRDARGRTPLMAATLANRIAIALRLIEAGSDVNARDHTQLTPYLCAGANGYDEIFHATLGAGADLRSVNRFGGTALLPSSEKGYLHTVQMCLDAGVAVNHVNALGWSALQEAVILGDGGRRFADVVATLVAAGADIHVPDRAGLSASMHAQALGQSRVIRIFGAAPQAAAQGPIDRVRASMRRSAYASALAMLAAAPAQEVDPIDLHYYCGNLLDELGHGDDAINEYRRGFELDRTAPEFLVYIAQCLRRLGRADKALQQYDDAITLQPTQIFARYQKSNYLRELNRHPQAVAEMDALLALQPGRCDYWFHKANSLRALGRHDEAIAAIEQAIALDPTNPLFSGHRDQSRQLLQA